jgi:tRNA A-37 threonylcarbamoyl transferase component Bud32
MSVTQVSPVVISGESAWRKCHGMQRQPMRLWLLRMVAKALRLDPLLPPTEHVGADAQRCEREMIGKLHQLGVRVPKIMRFTENELVLSDLGRTLSELCKAEKDCHQRYRMLKAGFDALLDLHQRGGYLNQAFARNMTLQWVDGRPQIGFIDFEQDPLEVMSLQAAQARDLLLYTYSTAYLLADDIDVFVDMFQHHLRLESKEVQRWSMAVIDRLSPLLKIGGFIEKKIRIWRDACITARTAVQSACVLVLPDVEVFFELFSVL